MIKFSWKLILIGAVTCWMVPSHIIIISWICWILWLIGWFEVRDGQRRMPMENGRRSSQQISEEILKNPDEFNGDETFSGHWRIPESTFRNRPQRISKEATSETPAFFGLPSPVERNGALLNTRKKIIERLLKRDPCKDCRLSIVIVRERLFSSAGRRSTFRCGPTFYLNCTIGDYREPTPFLVDTGCTGSAIDLNHVKNLGLLDQVDRTKRIKYEAMGGGLHYTYGVLHVSVRTLSGFTLIGELMVAEMRLSSPLIGLDILAVNNCSLILATDFPTLMIRDANGCPTLNKRNLQDAAQVEAKVNGKSYLSTLDTGSIRTVMPKSADFTKVPLSKPVYFNVAADNPICVSRVIASVELQIDGCVGHVNPMVLPEKHPMIGTDFLQNKRIDFIHGRVHLSSLV